MADVVAQLFHSRISRASWLSRIGRLLLTLIMVLPLMPPIRSAYAANLTITIDRTDDTNIPAAQACLDATPNDCSLRGAISKANLDLVNNYKILIPVGVYRLTLTGAGEAAQADYAISYYEQLLPLLSETDRGAVLFRLGQVKETLGRWGEARDHYHEALTLAASTSDLAVQLQCRIAIGEVQRRQGQFAEAALWYEQARTAAEQQGDQSSIAKALICEGTLAISRALDDRPNIANLLNNMSIIASYVGDLAHARALQEESLSIRRTLGNKWSIANSLNNLGMFATDQGELSLARASLEEAIMLQREIGDPSALATSLHSLANTLRAQAEYKQASTLYIECLLINRQLGDRWMLIQLLEDVGWLAVLQGDHEHALLLVGAAATARSELGSPLPPAEQAKLDTALAPARLSLGAAAEIAWQQGQSLGLLDTVAVALE